MCKARDMAQTKAELAAALKVKCRLLKGRGKQVAALAHRLHAAREEVRIGVARENDLLRGICEVKNAIAQYAVLLGYPEGTVCSMFAKRLDRLAEEGD